MSIRSRMVLLSSTVVAIAVVLIVVTTYFAVRSELTNQVDDALRSQAAIVKAAFSSGIVEKGIPDVPGDAASIAASVSDSESPAVQQVLPDGTLGLVGPRSEKLPIPESSKAIAKTGKGEIVTEVESNDDTKYRVLTVGVGENGAAMIGRSMEGVDDLNHSLRIALSVLLAFGILIAGFLGLLLGRRITSPVIELANTAEEIGRTHDLSKRIDSDRSDEIGRLADNFDRMLDTIETSQNALQKSVDAQKQLVADASHELRTPVASVRTGVETVLAHPDLSEEERSKILQAADGGLAELSELITDVIELAREEEAPVPFEPVRLDRLAESSIERLARLFPERIVEVGLAPSTVDGRPDRIARAIDNLLDNANKYSPIEKPIHVKVGDGLVIVSDDGPGISDSERAHVFDRFWRGAASRSQTGSGLGLAIVRQVAESHGGTANVAVSSSGGAEFRLSFPERHH